MLLEDVLKRVEEESRMDSGRAVYFNTPISVPTKGVIDLVLSITSYVFPLFTSIEHKAVIKIPNTFYGCEDPFAEDGVRHEDTELRFDWKGSDFVEKICEAVELVFKGKKLVTDGNVFRFNN